MPNTTMPPLSERNEEPADTHAGKPSIPIWTPATESRAAPELEGEVTTDVAVLGGGLVGLMTAHLCRSAGLEVVLLDARRVGSGESLRTTAHVTAHLDARWKKVTDDVGVETAALLWREAMASIDTLENTVRDLGVDCGWRRVPSWLFTESERGLFDLREEVSAAESAGIPCRLVEKDIPLSWSALGAVHCERQAQLDPEPFLRALAAHLEARGCRIFEHTPALEVREEPTPTVVTEKGSIRAKHVVVATHAPFNNRLLLQTKIAHYRTYAVALRGAGPLQNGLFWDDANPYHYVRGIDHDGRRLILVGGEDHRTGQDDDTRARIAALSDWASQRMPGAVVERAWSGQIIEPVDGLPYVGRNSLEREVYEATGFSGTGWAYGVLAARMLTAAIRGESHPLAETLAATRVTPIASAKKYIQENVGFPWHFFGDRLSPEATQISALEPGHGKLLMTRALHKVAVYRDAEGKLHALSPVCPHMGCIVDFNDLESSWDCPCHGSRFDVDGRLLNGPATTGLERLEDQQLPADWTESRGHPS